MNQSKKGPRFLTFDWPQGFLSEFCAEPDKAHFIGYHMAYEDYVHTRKIEYKQSCYVITDEVENNTGGEINVRLNWNLGTNFTVVGSNKYWLQVASDEWIELSIKSLTSGKATVFCGNEELPAGWSSLYYGEKKSINQLIYEVDTSLTKEVLQTSVVLKVKR